MYIYIVAKCLSNLLALKSHSGVLISNIAYTFFFLSLLQILHCQALTSVNFNSCKLIKKLPDLSMVPNLEKLNLGSFKKLKKVHYSVGRLKKLKEWYLYDCVKLETLPHSLKLNSLTQFSLKGCSHLKKLPIFSQFSST